MNEFYVFVAKEDGWYDTGTIATVMTQIDSESALFIGTKNGELDEEICLFEEFIRHMLTI